MRHGERVVHRDEPFFFLAVLEHREVNYPKHVVSGLVYQVAFFRKVEPERAERFINDLVLVRAEQQYIAGLGVGAVEYRFYRVLGHEFGYRGQQLAVFANGYPGKTFRLEGFDELAERVDIAAREYEVILVDKALGVYHADTAADVFHRALEYLEAAALCDIGYIDKLQTETRIGLIRAETAHRLVVRHFAYLCGEFDAAALFENFSYEPVRKIHHLLLRDERHFHVYLRELGLTVGAQVLVAEAARYLIVFIRAAYHQQLFVELRRLRQGVKRAVLDTRRNKIIARALGRGLAEIRRFYLPKTVLMQITARNVHHFAAQPHDLRHLVGAEIEIAIF